MPEAMTNQKVLTAAFDEKVLKVLRRRLTEYGPTEVGLALGLTYNVASSKVVPSLRRLIKAGRVKLVSKGRYTATMDEAEEKAKGGPRAAQA